MSEPLSIVVFGAGSIGLYVGGQLAAAGQRVCFIGRARFGDVITRSGLTLTHFSRAPLQISPDGFDYVHDAVSAHTALSTADIVLVCVKSQDSQDAAAQIAPHIGDNTLVISFQNGVRNPDILRASLGGTPVLGGVVPFNVTRTTDNTWHCGTEGDLIIGTHDDPRIEKLADAYQSVGQGCRLDPDITAVQWGKLLVNLNNGLNTLSGGPLKAGLLQRDYRRALAAMIGEGLALLSQIGVTPRAFGKADPVKMMKILKLPDFAYRIIMDRIVKIDAQARSSMLDDLEAGRVCEIDFLQGEIVALAARLSQSAPINARAQALVTDAFAKGRSPNMTGTEIWQAVKPQ